MSKEVSTKAAGLPVNLEDEIKKQLAEQKKHIGALPSNKISTKGKEFTLPDGSKGKTLECVIIDFAWFMANYPGVFNANAPKQPDCFAVGREDPESGDLKPHESVEKPHADNCKECPKNEWGSAATGAGKACKNQRRLLVMAPDATEDAEPMTLYCSPSSLKHFNAYINKLQNEHQMLPVQAITKISFNPDETYPQLQFEYLEPNANLGLFWNKRENAQEMLFRPTETKSEAA